MLTFAASEGAKPALPGGFGMVHCAITSPKSSAMPSARDCAGTAEATQVITTLGCWAKAVPPAPARAMIATASTNKLFLKAAISFSFVSQRNCRSVKFLFNLDHPSKVSNLQLPRNHRPHSPVSGGGRKELAGLLAHS